MYSNFRETITICPLQNCFSLFECYSVLFVDQSSIEAILDDWNLLTEIAELLEQGSGIALQKLALQFDIAEPLQLTSVEPSERFFHNLAKNNGGIKLADLKKFIEVDCNLKNKSIFPPIERDITQGIVDFTLESTLAKLKGRNWSYFLKHIADKLLENTFQLPSWKTVASRYKYTTDSIESFCINMTERPTVRLFQHLRCMEDVPTISNLKICLKEIQRNDIVKILNKRLPMTNQ